jgi:uncharacterized protein YggU (UPF0235/DUF167 family)
MPAARFAVRLTPRGGRDAIEGWSQGADGARLLKARVAVPPEDGKANHALLRLLAKRLGVPQSAVRIASGATARIKMIEVDGDAVAITARLAEIGQVKP